MKRVETVRTKEKGKDKIKRKTELGVLRSQFPITLYAV